MKARIALTTFSALFTMAAFIVTQTMMLSAQPSSTVNAPETVSVIDGVQDAAALVAGDIRSLRTGTNASTTNFSGASIEIPSAGIASGLTSFPVADGTWAINPYETAVGHLQLTDWFGGGNTVLAGHSVLPDGTPGIFNNLYAVSTGDEILVNVNGGTLRYTVHQIYVTSQYDLTPVLTRSPETLTLITCDIPSLDETTQLYQDRLVIVATRSGDPA
jgi:LPXTG-site transpeptidase (sortase) family protein